MDITREVLIFKDWGIWPRQRDNNDNLVMRFVSDTTILLLSNTKNSWINILGLEHMPVTKYDPYGDITTEPVLVMTIIWKDPTDDSFLEQYLIQ